MRVLGIESSCDETGVAIYDTEQGLLGQALYSQVEMHARYGGVVPELASRDHVQRVLPLVCVKSWMPPIRGRSSSMVLPILPARGWPVPCWWAPAWPVHWRLAGMCLR